MYHDVTSVKYVSKLQKHMLCLVLATDGRCPVH